MWMIDMVVFGLLYAGFTSMILAPALYLLTDLLDVAIEDLTNGDFSNVMHVKFRQPIMELFGFRFCGGEVYGGGRQALLVGVSISTCIVFGLISTIGYFTDGTPPYEALSVFVTRVIPYSTWILIPVGYLLLRGILKKIYTLIKKVNSLPDTPVDNK